MSLMLQLVQTQNLEPNLHFVDYQRGKAIELLDYWEHQPRLQYTMRIRGEERTVPYVLAPPSFMHYMFKDEQYGQTIGDMMFVNSDIAKEHPNWVPYVIMKLYSQKFVDDGLDESGKVRHFQSLYAMIRIAGMAMEEPEHREFLVELSRHERTEYFELDQEVIQFLGDRDYDSARREYLENHWRNRWVVAGRANEQLAKVGWGFDGHRNRAQAIMTALGDLDSLNVYMAASFTHALHGLDSNTQVLISAPYTSFAYAMTRQGNDLIDLVRFSDDGQPGPENRIVKLSGHNQTWAGLLRRLSYGVYQVEKGIAELIEAEKTRLDTLLLQTKQVNSEALELVTETRSLLQTVTGFQAAAKTLKERGGKYSREVAALSEASQQSAETLANLDDVLNSFSKLV